MDMVHRNSIPGKFAYIWQSKWVGIIAIKTERRQIPFLSDVLVAFASLDLKVPTVRACGTNCASSPAEPLHIVVPNTTENPDL